MAARPHCTTHNDSMELCLGTVRHEDLDISSLPALCQVFSSQVKSRQPHDLQKYIAVPKVLSLWLHGTGFLALCMHSRRYTSRSCGTVLAKVCYTLPDDKSTHVSERLRETVLPCPYFNALGHAHTRTTTSAAKMRDKEGNSVSLRLIFMLGSRLVGLDPAFCSSYLQMK